MDKEVKKEQKKLRLVVEGQDTRPYPKLDKIHFSTNGKKKHPHRGKNTYRRRLNKLRRTLRW